MRLEHKVAVVTGGGTGIGRSNREGFCERRCEGRDSRPAEDELEARRQIHRKKGEDRGWCSRAADQRTDVQEAVAATVPTVGRLDILVNDAGNLFHAAPLHDTPDHVWDETFDVFLKGTFRFIRAALPQMLNREAGRF